MTGRIPRISNVQLDADVQTIRALKGIPDYKPRNPEYSAEAAEAALDRMKRELGPQDSLLIYISSHGTQPVPKPGSRDARKMSIAAYDTGDATMRANLDWRWKVHSTSVPDTRVQELAQLPTRQTRVIIDTCYSGEILKDIPDESQRYILKTNGGVPERAGISMAAWSGEAYAAKGIFATDDGAAPAAGA